MRTSAAPDTIALTLLDDSLYVVFRDHGTSNQLYCAHSTDGLQWSSAKKITDSRPVDLKTEKFPGLATLNGKLVLAFTLEASSEVYVSLSSDGESWEAAFQTGIHNYTPALTTYLDNEGIETLAMVYSDQGGEQVHYSSSKDGKMWEKRNDPEAKCNRPVLATMGGLVQELQGRGILVTVYSSSKGPQLYSHFNSGPDYKDWGEGKQIGGQKTQNVGGLAWLPQPDSNQGKLDGCLVLVYQSTDDRTAVITRTWDGSTWEGANFSKLNPTPDDGYVPAMAFHHEKKLAMVYQSSQKLYVTFSGDGLTWKDAKEM